MTSMTDPDAPIPGLIWNFMPYRPSALTGGLAGPDQTTHCETPRHEVAQAVGAFTSGVRGLSTVTTAPEAVWVEMLWFPEEGVIARSWKTCDSCHTGMVDSRTATL